MATALCGCAGKRGHADSPAPAPAARAAPLPPPEEDPKAPGMIPQECEALLNHSREWGFDPAESWRPKTVAIAREAVDFFASFHLVPESTSTFARAWMASPVPRTAAEAKRSLERMDRAQSCDFLHAHRLVLALLRFRWPASARAHAASAILGFLRAQQERVSPSMARAVQIDVLRKAVRRGFVHADASAVEVLRRWFDEKSVSGLRRAEQTEDPLAQWKLNREELRVSEEARERLERILPR